MTLRPAPFDAAGLAKELLSLLGEEGVLATAPELAACAPTGTAPLIVAAPASLEELSAVVALADRLRVPVIPWGAGTKSRTVINGGGSGTVQATGGFARPPGIVLPLRRMSRVLDLDAGNLSARVQAGLPLRELNRLLSGHGLRLPLDPDDYDEATIGGTISCNTAGPLRLRYGTPRDFVLGLTAVTPSGLIIRAGGKTMKDVAGYDVKKLLVGSYGTLGVVADATLRLLPVPERSTVLAYHFTARDAAARFVTAILSSPLLPSALELLDFHAAGAFLGVLGLGASPAPDGALALVGLEGMAEDVAFERRAMAELAGEERGRSLDLSGISESPVWTARRRLRAVLDERSSRPIRLKASVPIGAVGTVFAAAGEAGATAGLPLAAVAHAGNGVVYFSVLARDEDDLLPAGRVENALRRLEQDVSAVDGLLIMERGPLALRAGALGPQLRADLRLMRAIKSALDPNNILNPGCLPWLGL